MKKITLYMTLFVLVICQQYQIANSATSKHFTGQQKNALLQLLRGKSKQFRHRFIKFFKYRLQQLNNNGTTPNIKQILFEFERPLENESLNTSSTEHPLWSRKTTTSRSSTIHQESTKPEHNSEDGGQFQTSASTKEEDEKQTANSTSGRQISANSDIDSAITEENDRWPHPALLGVVPPSVVSVAFTNQTRQFILKVAGLLAGSEQTHQTNITMSDGNSSEQHESPDQQQCDNSTLPVILTTEPTPDRALTPGRYRVLLERHIDNGFYDNNQRLQAVVRVGNGTVRLHLTCPLFQLEASQNCHYDYFKVNERTFCGSHAPTFTSAVRYQLEFKSDDSQQGKIECQVIAEQITPSGTV